MLPFSLEPSVDHAEPLRCIVYCSIATEPWPLPALQALAARAAAANGSQGITGQLIYLNQHFIQVLEGPEAQVEALFAAIARDPRHHRVRTVLRREVPRRAFPGWAMELAEGAPAELDAAAAEETARQAGALFATSLADLWDAPLAEGSTALRQPAQQQRARSTVERIFRSARRMVMRGGPGTLTVPALVADAAVTQPTFYRYFNGIDDLLRSGLHRVAMRRMVAWQAALRAEHFTSDAQLADFLARLGTQHFMNVPGVPQPLLKSALQHVSPIASQLSRAMAPAVLETLQRCNLPGAGQIDEEMMAALLAALIGAGIALAQSNPTRLRSAEAQGVAAGLFLGGLRAAVRKDVLF